MDFDNRYTMEVFKSQAKPPAMAPNGIHGILQAKVNNASAKLLANYDFINKQRNNAKAVDYFKGQMGRDKSVGGLAAADGKGVTKGEQGRLVKIP